MYLSKANSVVSIFNFIWHNFIIYVYIFKKFWLSKVNYIRNITDVDDKIIARAKELNIDATELTDKYITSMQEDFRNLGMIDPDLEPRADKQYRFNNFFNTDFSG